MSNYPMYYQGYSDDPENMHSASGYYSAADTSFAQKQGYAASRYALNEDVYDRAAFAKAAFIRKLVSFCVGLFIGLLLVVLLTPTMIQAQEEMDNADNYVEVEASVKKVIPQNSASGSGSRSLSGDENYDVILSYTFEGEEYKDVVMTSKLNHRNTWKRTVWVDKTEPVHVIETKPDGSVIKTTTFLVGAGWVLLVVFGLLLIRLIFIRIKSTGVLNRVSFSLKYL